MMPRLAALLISANFAVALGYGAILPLLPVLLARIGIADASATGGLHTGGVTSVYMLAFFVGALAWGRAVGRLGTRATLLAGLLGYAVALIAVAAASGPVSAYALRAAAGFFAGAVTPVVGVLAAAEPEPIRRGRIFAATGAATLVGLLVGPTLSGAVAHVMREMPGAADMSAATLLWAMAAPASIALLVAVVAARTAGLALAAAPAGASGEPAGWTRRSGAYAANFLALLGLGAMEVMLPLLGERAFALAPGELALLFAECSALMIVVQAVLFFSPVLARVPPRAVIAVGFGVMAIGAAALALARTESAVYIGVGLIAVSSGWLLPAIGYFASGPGGATGAVLGTLTAAGILGQAVGSAAGGVLYDRVAAGGLWLLAAALAAGIVLALRPEFDHGGRAFRPAAAGDHDQPAGHGP
jgi:MFS family permease